MSVRSQLRAAGNYALSGNPISLPSGLAVTAQPTVLLPNNPSISLPIQLSGSQTWTMNRSSVFD